VNGDPGASKTHTAMIRPPVFESKDATIALGCDMFEIENLIEDCKSALGEGTGHKVVREVLARAVSEPGEVVRALGEPSEAGLHTLYHADNLTILNVVWSPHMMLEANGTRRLWMSEHSIWYEPAAYSRKRTHGSMQAVTDGSSAGLRRA